MTHAKFEVRIRAFCWHPKLIAKRTCARDMHTDTSVLALET